MGLLDLIFPKRCIGCGREGKYVCGACEVGLWEEEQICPICRRASRYGLKHTYCRAVYPLDGLTCFWAYEGLAKKLITNSKYKHHFDMLKNFAIDSEKLIERPEFARLQQFLAEKPIVVPIPLHVFRQRERGFNQAEILAMEFARIYGLRAMNLLVRVKNTEHQVGKERAERLKNVQGAFKLSIVNSKLSIPKTVILVDDVWTTGSTMSECCKVLKMSGVRCVWGLALAR